MPSAWGLAPLGAHILSIAEEAPTHQTAGDGGKGETSGMRPLHPSTSFFEKGPKKLGVLITYKLIFPSCEVPVEWMLHFFGHSGFVGSSLRGGPGYAAVQPAPMLV